MYESVSAKAASLEKIRSGTDGASDRKILGRERLFKIASIFTTTDSRGSASKTGDLPRSWTIAFLKSPYSNKSSLFLRTVGSLFATSITMDEKERVFD